MKKFYAETNADKVIVITSEDDDSTAVWFPVSGKAEAEGMDISNLVDMTADVMRAEYPEHVFDFSEDAPEWERIERI